jgi:hypothetical protein
LIRDDEPKPSDIEFENPPETSFRLSAGYLDDANVWHRDFEVRELTGRDEEALGRMTKVGPMLIEIIQRGLVSVGNHSASPELVDALLFGDWETVLLAIRSVTFGREVMYTLPCMTCRADFSVTVDIMDLPKTELTEPSDLVFTVDGRHGDRYRVSMPTGVVQRKILQNFDYTVAEKNTLILTECLLRVGDNPSLGRETVLNMPLADRRTILNEIFGRKPGPRLEEVTTLCPSCGAENPLSLSVASLFQ